MIKYRVKRLKRRALSPFIMLGSLFSIVFFYYASLRLGVGDWLRTEIYKKILPEETVVYFDGCYTHETEKKIEQVCKKLLSDALSSEAIIQSLTENFVFVDRIEWSYRSCQKAVFSIISSLPLLLINDDRVLLSNGALCSSSIFKQKMLDSLGSLQCCDICSTKKNADRNRQDLLKLFELMTGDLFRTYHVVYHDESSIFLYPKNSLKDHLKKHQDRLCLRADFAAPEGDCFFLDKKKQDYARLCASHGSGVSDFFCDTGETSCKKSSKASLTVLDFRFKERVYKRSLHGDTQEHRRGWDG